MKLLTELILHEIMCLKLENAIWLQSQLHGHEVPKVARDCQSDGRRVMYPNFFTTVEKMNYLSPAPGVSYCCVDQMHESEKECKTVTKQVFDNRSVLERKYSDDLTVLRKAWTFRTFLLIGNVDVILEIMTIASTCKSVPKNFLEPDRIGIIPIGDYTDNRKQQKAIAWVMLEGKAKGS